MRDRVRVVRALEVFFRTGRPISEEQRAGASPLEGFRVLVIGLDPGREALRRAVEARTRAMLEHGLVAEVRSASSPPACRPTRGRCSRLATGRRSPSSAAR